MSTHLIKFLIIVAFLTSCNSVKQVLNNPKKFDIVAKEVVKRGYCINDTVIIDSSRIDTVYKEHYIIDTLTITNSSNIDTTLASGAKVTIKDGVLSVKCPPSKDIIKTIKQVQYIRDTKLEDILKQDLKLKSDSLNKLMTMLEEEKLKVKQSKFEAIKQKSKFVILLIAIGIGFVIYISSKFRLL